MSESVHDLQLDGTKIGHYRDRVEAWSRGERIAPITMDIAWTRKCAAACNFCYASLQSSNDGGDITREIAWHFLEDMAEIGVKGVSLISDGESTEVEYFADSVEYGSKLGLQMGTSSNGLRLTPKVLEQVLPHLTYLRFNFSGGDKHRWAQIMGLKQPLFDRVVKNIKAAAEIKKRDNLPVNLNVQFVVMPQDADQIIPFAKLAKELLGDSGGYGILKHCADSPTHELGVDYTKYKDIFHLFREAETYSDANFRIATKWTRIQDEGKENINAVTALPLSYKPVALALLVAVARIQESNKKLHIGWISGPYAQRFKDIFHSERYWEVMNYLASPLWNSQRSCGANCLQQNTNQWLDQWKKGKIEFPTTEPPPHMGFL